MSTRSAATAEAAPFSRRTGNRVALLIILLPGCAGATLIALPHPTPNNPAPVAYSGPAPTIAGPLKELAETVAVAEAYYAEHHTYEGITPYALRRYDIDSTLMPAKIYFATKERYCVETRSGWETWSRNGPLAPAQPHLCKRLELEASPASHDGRPPDLPLLPRQAHVPGKVVKGPETADTWIAALSLERFALRLNIFWINHRGTYTGAREHLIDRTFGAKIVNALGNSYCIVWHKGKATFVKKGPSEWIRSSSHGGPAACSQPAGPLIEPSNALFGVVVA